MANKIYLPPESVGKPPSVMLMLDNSIDAYRKAETEFVDKVKTYAKENGSSDIRGEVIRFPYADSFAAYVVFSLKPVTLIHLQIGDAWEYPHAKFLPASEIRSLVERQKKLDEMFATAAAARQKA